MNKLYFITLILLLSCHKKQRNTTLLDGTEVFYTAQKAPFYHGVASGDPSTSSVIIWTRVTTNNNEKVKVKWQIATDSLQKNIVQKGSVYTNSHKDFTVKNQIKKLEPDTYYWYQFFHDGKPSVVGRTKTLPLNTSEIRLLTVSCNAYEAGYFNAYQVIAETKDKVDAVIHLGDYIYEGFLPQYFTKKDRIPLPKKEAISLKDYRTRYAQYRLDSALQKAHQMHPFINIWDDHEIANDAYKNGAKTHSNTEDGEYEERKNNAKKVFYEWLPIEDKKNHYRDFKFGNIAELFMLDGRLEGRTKQAAIRDENFEDAERFILGEKQTKWLFRKMEQSKVPWKLIGNPVLFADFDFTTVTGKHTEIEIDSWQGYPNERKKIIDAIKNKKIKNIVFLSGDSHSSWIFNIKDYAAKKTNPIALEIGVPSISSDNWGARFSKSEIETFEKELYKIEKNNHLNYVNLSDHGFVEAVFTKNKSTYTWHFIDKDRKKIIEKTKFSYTQAIQ